ncbi:MAG: HPr family phosphocarrier protein [Peptoniphilaceae bacterium]|nr:HPr family phosphocarrier protein [Peptoniphilaceae bacterium]MCI6659866.1 HPr family phosphocarrier protein [Peptoniphilaceae bacterium]MDD7434174.1 HPr family phosphocarrier protein [Peptoniphilaceae bacterium]MDD7543166.1 HPr family phosphocarrier protein [Peptoniphilaceae bacterium]MDY3075270.1 HPr family phosphocarrier protein [Peptoniphilaceae bacterium]
MEERKIQLENAVGLMGRPAANFISLARSFVSDIYLERDHKIYNGKSIMSILSMGAGRDSTVILRIEGEDEKDAAERLDHYLTEEILQI